MPFVLICRDRPGALETRLAHRDAHLEYARASSVVNPGGPILAGGQMAGSLAILDVATREEAEAWAAGDPYGKAGLFESVEILEWKRVLG